MSRQKIRDEGREQKYFAMIPHMADDDLDPYEYRLYGHYKRVCGESENGLCWESTRTTAQKCKMSGGKVSTTKQSLAAKGYINVQPGEGDETDKVTLCDLMAENIQRIQARSPGEQETSRVHHMNTTVHTVNAPVHPVNESVHQVKQRITIEEKPNEEESWSAPAQPERDVDPLPFQVRQQFDAQNTVAQMQGYELIQAYIDAFPANAKPAIGAQAKVKRTAQHLAALGYTAAEVRQYVTSRLAEGRDVSFHFLENDLAVARAKRGQVTQTSSSSTTKSTPPKQRPNAPRPLGVDLQTAQILAEREGVPFDEYLKRLNATPRGASVR